MIVNVDLGDADAEAVRRIVEALAGGSAPFSVADEASAATRGIRIGAHGCDLLSEDADWDAPTWSMTPDAIEELEHAWRVVFDSTDSGVVITAIWSDDEPTSEVTLSRSAFVQLTRSSLIGTHTRYRIAPSPAISE